MDLTALERRDYGFHPVTGLLWNQNLRVPLEVPVLAFGGGEGFRLPLDVVDGEGNTEGGNLSVFVAGGVGITPLMAQAKAVLSATPNNLKVLWSLRTEDLPLAAKIVGQIEGLGRNLKLFVTGQRLEQSSKIFTDMKSVGVDVVESRLDAKSLLEVGERRRRTYYCCAGTGLMTNLSVWLEGEEMVSESFNY